MPHDGFFDTYPDGHEAVTIASGGDPMRLVVISLITLAVGVVAIVVTMPQDKACLKMEAKINLAQDFCQGMAISAVSAKCKDVGDDPQDQGTCMQALMPYAMTSCLSFIHLKEQQENFASICL